jgi:hypothetical protein
MPEQTDSGGIISEAELAQLTELFRLFEGLQAPLAPEPRVAKQKFHDMVIALYAAKVKPAFQSLSFHDFLTFTRRTCRKRMAADDNYPCP